LADEVEVRISATATRQLEEALVRGLLQGARTAGNFLVGRIKRKIDRPNRLGRDPSRPGEPPKKVTVRLQKSIASTVGVEGKEVVLAVGTNVRYGRYLEGGTSRMAARPWLRPTVAENLENAGRIIVGSVNRAARGETQTRGA
jgi:HK97 gp10 family phage protein